MTFEREERIAFARIISDLIEADFIVEEDEMKAFDELRSRKEFSITDEMLSDAKRISFADAIRVLQNHRGNEDKQLLTEQLCNMSLSDGMCVPLEALQILAVKYALDGKGRVYSIPEGSSFIDNMKVIYIENEDDTETDAFISSHYRVISNEFRVAGFDFVYIPKIVEDFQQMNSDYLHRVITYLMPKIDEEKVKDIQRDLCSMTTSRFGHDLLYKKMGINMLSSKPAFLFKIGESAVADKSGTDDMERNIHSNFLLVPIDAIEQQDKAKKNVLDQVVELMDSYRSMVSEDLILRTRPMGKRFLYYGFHRSLFDLIAYGKDKQDYKLIINLKNKTNPVVLRPIDAKPANLMDFKEDLPIDLNTQPYALYILMVYMSLLKRGLDWNDYASRSELRKEILLLYNTIYKLIGKGNGSSEYRDKIHVSRIKKSLRSHEKIVSNIDLFIPEKLTLGADVYLNVPVPPDLVYVIEGTEGQEKEVRMVDSVFWKSELWSSEK